MSMIGEPGALQMPVPAENVFPGYLGNIPKWVVLHKTASGGTAQDIARFFASTPDRRSAHYIVGQDGTVVQCVNESDGAGANCCVETGYAPFLPGHLNLNLVTISIEHCDPAPDNSTPLTAAQADASFRLVYGICKRHGIPMRRGDAEGGIIGHADIAPLTRARCPGNYPWTDLFTWLTQEEMMLPIDLNIAAVAAYFQPDSNGWLCRQTNKNLHGEILSFYRYFGNSALCGLTWLGLPLSNEIPLPGSKYGAVRQHFENGVAFYDPGHEFDSRPGATDARVYLAHLYSGYGQDPKLMELQAQIGQLQAQLQQAQVPSSEHDAIMQIKQIVGAL